PGGGRIEIRSRTEEGHAVVEVADSGCGIPESTRSRIFDPFFSTKGEDGLGLGLSVVYGIVQRHGGTIEVDSTPGAGTTVRVRVPNAPTRGAAEPEATSAPVEGAGRRILAIDDEEAILELVQDILTEQGFEVVTASGGQEAIAKFEPGRYDLVVSDLGLRDMSGWEVVNAIRSRDAAVGVLLLTGWGATLSPERVEEYGIDAVMNKPFEMGALLRRAGDVLEETERRRVAGEPTG
ncbi:MAG: response regulator, partial [Gemmatimonadetes bacterium]|nr:response regulator [Gemmatimonadota bacterium]